jgi:23S rRNA (guanosine2251-2'-O)-methyltransferase
MPLLPKKIYLCGQTPTPPNPRIHKAAVGTEQWVPWEYHPNIVSLIRELKAQGKTIIAVEQHPNSILYAEVERSVSGGAGGGP